MKKNTLICIVGIAHTLSIGYKHTRSTLGHHTMSSGKFHSQDEISGAMAPTTQGAKAFHPDEAEEAEEASVHTGRVGRAPSEQAYGSF